MREIDTKRVKPVKEVKRYEIEVYVSYHAGAQPFVVAGIANGTFRVTQPTGDIVERYVFEVEQPDIKPPKLKGSL